MARYFAHISHKGKIRYGDVPGSIGVLEAPNNFMPIGQASQAGFNLDGPAPCQLFVHGAPDLGRWVIVDRRFVVVDSDSANRSDQRRGGPAALGDAYLRTS